MCVCVCVCVYSGYEDEASTLYFMWMKSTLKLMLLWVLTYIMLYEGRGHLKIEKKLMM